MSEKIVNDEDHKKTLGESETQKESEIIIELELGDIIKIFNPLNELLNENTFIIDYIDSTKIKLINVDTLNEIILKINEDGIIGDGSITKIELLSRSEYPGYAKQNNLLPNTWINIYFGGEFPVILTGEITNLEEDMIEIKTYPDQDYIYINFGYRGLPEDLPIETIEIREKPEVVNKDYEETQDIDETKKKKYVDEDIYESKLEELSTQPQKINTEKLQIKVPIEQVKTQFKEFIIKADQIKFGHEVLGPISQFIDVNANRQRYSIETQLSDLLDELLSTIPNNQRTNRVLNNIHTTIDRFKQLRELFSEFDEYGNVKQALTYSADYKPLLEYFIKFEKNLYWILPVIKNIKKIYDDNNGSEEISDIQLILPLKDINDIVELQDNYKANQLVGTDNKYVFLNEQLEIIMKPFDYINIENKDEMNEIIFESYVKTDINTIIDNLGDIYSTVFNVNNTKTRRFVIQRYNLGLTKLDATSITGSKMISQRVKLTNSDVLSLKSILTLPEPTIRFSRVNLPSSNILDKAFLSQHFINYWELLKQNIKINNIVIDNFDNKIEYNENNFVNNIKNYMLDIENESFKDYSKKELYFKFISHIIPKTRVLFNLIKKYINGKLSIVNLIGYLEPFLVYGDNLTYMQYKEIIRFIYQKISEYNTNFINNSKMFYQLKRLSNERHSNTNVFNLINIITDNKLSEDIKDLYNLNDDEYIKGNLYVNSEILTKIVKDDYGKLYNSALSAQSFPLMFPNEFSSILDNEKINNSNMIKTLENKKTCNNIIIAKYYDDLIHLENDNDKQIYFDKKYDYTNYGILNNYEKEIMSKTSEDFFVFLMNEMKNKYKLSDEDAEYLSNTLIDGHKSVLNGQYAILYMGTKSNVPYNYYIRKNNKWELDETFDMSDQTDDYNLLCNLQEKCISNIEKDTQTDKCESFEITEKKIQNKLLGKILDEFDIKYQMSKDEIKNMIDSEYLYNLELLPSLRSIKNSQMLKYNNKKYELGYTEEENSTQIIISPYLKLRDMILGQEDFVKKQQDIIRFAETFTRKYYEDNSPTGIKESEHWLYCIKTNTQLLPTFKYDMASAFVSIKENYEYNEFVELLIKRIGKLSDDGNFWVDKYSGWTIKLIDFDIEEGYEEGFKISTRDILEQDIGDKLVTEPNKIIKYSTPELKMINNIINAITSFMGISIDSQKEFIMGCVTNMIKALMPSEEDYKKYVRDMSKKNKNVPSYEELYYSTLLYNTFGMIIIGIQTSVPSIRTRRTFPGCIRSFIGYPFDGTGDYSSVNYLACIANKIKSKDHPWSALRGKNEEYISNKIKAYINGSEKVDGLIKLSEVRRKIDEKTEYLLSNPEVEIPEEHNILNWSQFLPPLIPFKIKQLTNISSEFESSLLSSLRSGSSNQRDKILVVESKIIQYSLAIQEIIHSIVNKKKLILQKSNNDLYLENSCCNDKNNISTIKYFEDENSDITNYNKIVSNLSNILNDINYYSRGQLLQSLVNTKNIYPPISNEHSSETIYLAFIQFCNFKNLLPINDDLLPICGEKPTLSENDSFNEIVSKLKNEGKNYSKEMFLRLYQIVSRFNVVNLELDKNRLSCVSMLLKILENMEDEKENVIDESLRNLIINALDTFDIASEDVTLETRELNNYLIKNIEKMKIEIIDFMNKNSHSKTSKKSIRLLTNYINNLSEWNILKTTNSNNKIANDSLYTINNYMKNSIDYLINVFPNIVLNKINYGNLKIPKYWNLSVNHNNNIEKYISDFYGALKQFYDDPILYNILNSIQKMCKNICILANHFPSFTSIKKDDKIFKAVFDERTCLLMFEYLLLKVFICYIELSDQTKMVAREVEKDEDITDIYSVDYLESKNIKTNIDYESTKEVDIRLLGGDKKKLRQHILELFIAYVKILNNSKDTIDINYEQIQDRVFKLKEKEKNLVTDRLKFMTDEERDADTILKINKLGPIYSKGLHKTLVEYDKDVFEEDKEFRDKIMNFERSIFNKTGATGDDLENLVNEYMEEQMINDEIENEVYDMSYMNDDYFDGNVDGVGAPEVEDYEYYE